MDEVGIDYQPPLMTPARPDSRKSSSPSPMELDLYRDLDNDPVFRFWYMMHPNLSREQAWQAFQKLTQEQLAWAWEQLRQFAESFKEYLLYGPLLPAGGGIAPEKYQAEHRIVPGWVLWKLARLIDEKTEKTMDEFRNKIIDALKSRSEPEPSDSEGSYNGKSRGAGRQNLPPRFQPTVSRQQKAYGQPDKSAASQQSAIFHIPAQSSSISTLRSFMCSTLLRNWIRRMGLFMLPTPADTHCLFHAIDCQLPSRSYQCNGIDLRRDAVKKIQLMVQSGQTLEEYLGSSALLFMSSADPTLQSALEFLNMPFAQFKSTGRESWGGYEHVTLLAKLYEFYAVIFNSTCSRGQCEQRVQLVTPSGSYHTLDDDQVIRLLKTVSRHRTFDDRQFPLPPPLLSTDSDATIQNGPAPIIFLSYEEDFLAPSSELPPECQTPDKSMSHVPAHWSALKQGHERGRLADHYNAREVLASIPVRIKPPEKFAGASPPPVPSGAKKKRRRNKRPASDSSASPQPAAIRSPTPIETIPELPKPKNDRPPSEKFSSSAPDESWPFFEREEGPDTGAVAPISGTEWPQQTPSPPLLRDSDDYSEEHSPERPESPDSGVEDLPPEPEPEPPDSNGQETDDKQPDLPPPVPRQPTPEKKVKRKSLRLAIPERLLHQELAVSSAEDQEFLTKMDHVLAEYLLADDIPSAAKKKKKVTNLAREWRAALRLVASGLKLLEAQVHWHEQELEIHLPIAGLPVEKGSYREALELFFHAATHYDFPYAWALLALLDEGDSSSLPPYEIRLQTAVPAALHGNRQALALLAEMLLYQHPYRFPQVILIQDLATLFQHHPAPGQITFTLHQEHEYSRLLAQTPPDQALNLLSSTCCHDLLFPAWLGRHLQPDAGSNNAALQLLELAFDSGNPKNFQQLLLEKALLAVPAGKNKSRYTSLVRWLTGDRQATGGEQKKGKGKKGKKAKAPALRKAPLLSGSATLFLVTDACLAGGPESLRDCLQYHVSEAIDSRNEWQLQLYHIRRTVAALKGKVMTEWDRLLEKQDSAAQQVLGASYDPTQQNYLKHWQMTLYLPPEPAVASGAPSPDEPRKTTTAALHDNIPTGYLPVAWLKNLDDRVRQDLKAACPVAEWESSSSACCKNKPKAYCHLMAALTLLQAEVEGQQMRLQALERPVPEEDIARIQGHLAESFTNGAPYAGTLLAIVASLQISKAGTAHSSEAFAQLVPLLYDEAFLGVDDAIIKLLPFFLQEDHPLQLDSPGLPGLLLKLSSQLPWHFHYRFTVRSLQGKSRKTFATTLLLPSGSQHELLVNLLEPGPLSLLDRLSERLQKAEPDRRDRAIRELLRAHAGVGLLTYDRQASTNTKLLYAINHRLVSQKPQEGSWITSAFNKRIATKPSQLASYLTLLLSLWPDLSPQGRVQDSQALVSAIGQWQPSSISAMLLTLSDPVVYQPDLLVHLPEGIPGLQHWQAQVMMLHWYSDYLANVHGSKQNLDDLPAGETFRELLESQIQEQDVVDRISARQQFLMKQHQPTVTPEPEITQAIYIEPVTETSSITEPPDTGEIIRDRIRSMLLIETRDTIDSTYSYPPPPDPEPKLEQHPEPKGKNPDEPGLYPEQEFIDADQWHRSSDSYFLDRIKAAQMLTREELEVILEKYKTENRQLETGFLNTIKGLLELGIVVENKTLLLFPNLKHCQTVTAYLAAARETQFPYAGYFYATSLLLCNKQDHDQQSAKMPITQLGDMDAKRTRLVEDLVSPLFESAILGVEQASLLLLTIYNHPELQVTAVPQGTFPAQLFSLHSQRAGAYRLKLKLSLDPVTGLNRILAKVILSGEGHNQPGWLRGLVEEELRHGPRINIQRLSDAVEKAVKTKKKNIYTTLSVAPARAFISLLQGSHAPFKPDHCTAPADPAVYGTVINYYNPSFTTPPLQLPSSVRTVLPWLEDGLSLEVDMNFEVDLNLGAYLNTVTTVESAPSPSDLLKVVKRLGEAEIPSLFIPTIDPFMLRPALLTNVILANKEAVNAKLRIWHGRVLLLHWLTGTLIGKNEAARQLLQLMAMDSDINKDIKRLITAGGFPSPEIPEPVQQLLEEQGKNKLPGRPVTTLRESLSDPQLSLDERIMADLSLPYSQADFSDLDEHEEAWHRIDTSQEQSMRLGYVKTLYALKLLDAQIEGDRSIRLKLLAGAKPEQKSLIKIRKLLGSAITDHNAPYAGLILALTALPEMKTMPIDASSLLNSVNTFVLYFLIPSSLAGVEQAAVLVMHLLSDFLHQQGQGQGIMALLLQLFDQSGDTRLRLRFLTDVHYEGGTKEGDRHHNTPVMRMEGAHLDTYYELLQPNLTAQDRVSILGNARIRPNARTSLTMVLALRYRNAALYGPAEQPPAQIEFMNLPVLYTGADLQGFLDSMPRTNAMFEMFRAHLQTKTMNPAAQGFLETPLEQLKQLEQLEKIVVSIGFYLAIQSPFTSMPGVLLNPALSPWREKIEPWAAAIMLLHLLLAHNDENSSLEEQASLLAQLNDLTRQPDFHRHRNIMIWWYKLLSTWLPSIPKAVLPMLKRLEDKALRERRRQRP
ncbi:MAG: hypothetical protein ACR2PT_03420 [Endozoicomonas sp.]